MQHNPLVSIIIPVYNGTNYLREAIDSALAQTYSDIEILVINDGSDDNGGTEEIALSYGDRIRYFSKPNGGVASALNLGIKNMKGDYFAWLSHDDIYYPTKIEQHIEFLKALSDKNTITHCAANTIDIHNNIINESLVPSQYLKNKYLTILSTSIGGCSLLIPYKCFDIAGRFNENLRTTQDVEMWLRIAKAGFSFAYIPEILYGSRLHPEQDSIKLASKHLKEKDEFNLWALTYLGLEINSIYRQLKRILLLKRCKRAYIRLVLIKYGHGATIYHVMNILEYCIFDTARCLWRKTIKLLFS